MPALDGGSVTAPFETDPVTGVRMYELSHPWGHGVPAYPGFGDVHIHRTVTHAKDGVLSQRIRTVMHSGTHVNAPKHLVQRATGIGEMPLDTFFGTGVIISIPKQRWELVTAEDLNDAGASINEGDIVIVVTGWHEGYADSQEYFAHGPGLSPAAAQWLVDRKVKLVGVDTAYVDHPLATTLAEHRGGPKVNYLSSRYESMTGRLARDDFPELNPAHRILLGANIPTIENVGGDVNALLDARVTLQCFPWRWIGGDACGVRLTALLDPLGEFRFETGEQNES